MDKKCNDLQLCLKCKYLYKMSASIDIDEQWIENDLSGCPNCKSELISLEDDLLDIVQELTKGEITVKQCGRDEDNNPYIDMELEHKFYCILKIVRQQDSRFVDIVSYDNGELIADLKALGIRMIASEEGLRVIAVCNTDSNIKRLSVFCGILIIIMLKKRELKC